MTTLTSVNGLFDLLFFLVMVYVLILLLFYVVILCRTFDNGHLRRYTTKSTLDAVTSSRDVVEMQALSEIEKSNLSATVYHLHKQQRDLAHRLGIEAHLTALLISSDEDEVARIQQSLERRTAVIVRHARRRFGVQVAIAATEPITAACRRLERASRKEHARMLWAGLAENCAAAYRGSRRFFPVSDGALLGILVILALFKFLLRDRLPLTGDLVALVGVMTLVVTLTLSPTIVLARAIRQARETEIPGSRQTGAGRLVTRRTFLFVIPGMLIALLLGAVVLYYGPPRYDWGSTDNPESSLFGRAVLLVFAVGAMWFLYRAIRDTMASLSPKAVQRIGGLRLYVHHSGQPPQPVHAPVSARLESLGSLLVIGPVIGMFAAYAVFMAVWRPSETEILLMASKNRAVEQILLAVVILLILGFLLLAGSGVARLIERRRRYALYEALGLDFVKLRSPLLVGAGYLIVSTIVLFAVGSVGPECSTATRTEWEACVDKNAAWFAGGVLGGLAWVLSGLVVGVWGFVQSRRIRRQDSSLASEARRLSEQLAESDAPEMG